MTADNWRRKNLSAPFQCPLCVEEEETVKHLFLECKYTGEIWQHVTAKTKLSTTPKSMDELWNQWRNQISIHISKVFWDCLVIAINWTVWKERNRRIFRFEAYSAYKTLHKTATLFKEWASIHKGKWEVEIKA